MDFREALRPELTSNEFVDIPHEEKYEMIINAIGYEEVKKCIPFPLDRLKKAYKEDKNLNNLSMKKWDLAGGFVGWPSGADYVGSVLTRLYYEKLRVNTFSCCESVCILKNCARMWIEESESEEVEDANMQ